MVEGLAVEGDHLRDVPQHEVQPEQTAPVESRHRSEVPGVFAVAQVDAGRPAQFVGHIVDAVQRPGTDAGYRREVEVLFHQGIQRPRRV